MGYRLPERTARINFEGTDYDGAEVVVSLNVKIGLYRQIVAQRESGDFETAIEVLSGLIREWNLEDDDGPIPVSPEGFDRTEVGFVKALLAGWEAAMQGVTSVAAPLGENSTHGSTSTNATPHTSPTGS